MWNSSELVRREKAEDEFRRQRDDMLELLSQHITKELVNEWLLDICDEVARCRDIDDPVEHIDDAYMVLAKVMFDAAIEAIQNSAANSVSH